jgi:transposase
MKKDTTRKTTVEKATKRTMEEIRKLAAEERLTIGLDLGDRESSYCILNEQGEKVIQDKLATSKAGLNRLFEKMPGSRVALEVGAHSPWVSRQLEGLGHEAIVANPRNVAWISQSRKKNDQVDPEKLARLARMDVKLLSPIRHRSEQAQRDLMVIRARATLVETRTKLINTVRGLVKSVGERVKDCDSEQWAPALLKLLSKETRGVIEPLVNSIEEMSKQIGVYDEQIEKISTRYEEVKLLTPVYGVGRLTALTYILTIDDPRRFHKSREVGGFLGLQPSQRESGESQPQLGISKEGDRHLRWMLVQCAHCILRQGAPDSDLRRWGMAKLEPEKPKLSPGEKQNKKGKQKGKRRVLVAIARKLAVLLHRLWVNGEVYDPLYQAKAEQAARAARKKVA